MSADADNPEDRIDTGEDNQEEQDDAEQHDENSENGDEQYAPEWVENHGFEQETTYAQQLNDEYWWLISDSGEKYTVVVVKYDGDGGDGGDAVHGVTVELSTKDDEWWESEQKIRGHKNNLDDDDDVDVPPSVLESRLLEAHRELGNGVGDALWGGDGDDDGWGDIELPDPLGAEDLFDRTEAVYRYRFGATEEFHVYLEDDAGRTQKITLEGTEWTKEDGESTSPAVEAKAEAVLDERVSVSWQEWRKLKAHWRQVKETKHEEAETRWEYRADEIKRRVFDGARITRERDAVMSSGEQETIAWFDAEHAGKVVPDGEDVPAVDEDEPVVWVRMSDVARAVSDAGVDLTDGKRSKMRKLTQALRRKGYVARDAWQTSVAGFNARLIPFVFSAVPQDEEDVVGGSGGDEITPGGAPVGGDDDDDDDDDDAGDETSDDSSDAGDDAGDGGDADASADESESAVDADDDTGDGGGEGDNTDGEDAGDSDDAAGDGADAGEFGADELRLVEKCVRKHSDAWDDPVAVSKVESEVVSRAGVNSSPTVNPDAVPAMLEELADDDDSMVAHAGTTRDGNEEQYAYAGGDGR